MYKVNDINEWYVTKMTVIDEYTKMVACFLYCNCRADVVEFDGFGYPFLVSLVNKKTLPLLSKKIQDVFGMEGINGPFIAELCKYRSKLEESDVGLYADYFNVKGGLYDKEIEKILNAE
ncbi:hypothetical protein ECANGB1_182 [Enterospora canceri]|uniref:Uncharacterized protein n=1 Tax=Enterospora canceri TaxID=1081671 RepID=A0A1Y1S4L7_9MICR|nr:hypothetical protein ECANGB1_182 [Enterospora canceri]